MESWNIKKNTIRKEKRVEGESVEDVKLEKNKEESSQKEKWALVAHMGGKKKEDKKVTEGKWKTKMISHVH